MSLSPANWRRPAFLLALSTIALSAMVGCQGFSSGKTSSQTTQQGTVPGDLTTAPASLTFGNVAVGSTQLQSETVSNTGGSTLTISQAAVSDPNFSISGLNLPVTLAAGASTTFNLVFAPQSAAAASGTVALTNDGSNATVNIAVSGTGVAAGALTATPTSLSFGSVQVGQSQSSTETLNNTGGEDLTITQATLTAAGYSDTGLTLPLTVPAGQSVSFPVQFSPTAAGASNGLLSLTVSGANATFDIALSGTGVTAATLVATPASLSFGSIDLGQSQTLTETLNNSGGENLTITQASVTGAGFSYSGLNLPLTLVPGQSSTFGVVFSPVAGGVSSGTLSLTLSGSSTPFTIPLAGTGVSPGILAASPATLTFSNVQLGKSQTQTVSISNTGGSNTTISQDSVAGSGFSISGLSTPLTLAPGQSASLSVTFTPQILGTVSGSVAIASDASNSNLTIALTGTAAGSPQGQLSVSPTTINVGSVTVGTSGTATGTLSATGASVSISSVSVPSAEFTVSGLNFPVLIAAGKSVNFTVTFTPQSSGVATSTATFASNASNSPTAATVTGTGVAAPVYSVSLSWTASTSPNISGYNVYRRTGTTGSYAKINSSLDALTSYSDSNVADGQTYYYETTAVNSSGVESAASAAVQAVIPAP
jgi:hypothetical protein